MRFTSFFGIITLASSLVASAPAPVAGVKALSSISTRNSPDTAAAASSELVARDTTTDAIVYIGDVWTTTLQSTLNAILDTETNILYMAEQIGVMADRIVYVTEISQTGTIEVISLVVSLVYLGVENGSYAYQAVLVPVAALPTSWV